MNTSQPPSPGLAGTQPAADVRTFLLVDVRGYTRFTLEHGDEAAARLASQFATLVRDVVEARGGELLELRGDEALIVFTSARRALRAAAELQDRFIAELLRDPAQWLPVGMGLDAGEAVPVEGGYRGGALNLAGRLVSLAGPGEVLASEAVIHLAGKLEGLTYVERGLVQLKGFSDLVRVIRVEFQVAPEQPPQAPASSTSQDVSASTWAEPELPIGGFLGALPDGELIAREAELGRLLGALDTVMGGTGRLLMLAGEPGVGKTRLAQEVTRVARNRRFLVATGRCYESRGMVPYYPFLEALAAIWTAAPPSLRAEVPRRWPLLTRLLPEQSSAPALSAGQDEQEHLFRAVTGFVQAIATELPVAMLLDDLHWADSASLDLLQHLARHTRGGRVLLLGTYRDVEVGRQHPLERMLLDLNREKLLEEVAIRRLPREGTAALTASTLGTGEVSEEFADLLHRYTEGNAFFIQEVLRALVERGDLYHQDGQWGRRAVADIEIPRSVRSAIGERTLRLTGTAQEVLQEASVLGQTFAFDVLQAMSGRSEADVEAALEEALAAGLVREAGKDEYAFNHALTQQTLSAELPARRKRRLHRAAGEALEQRSEPGHEARAAELAWHFLEGDDAERALRYSIVAGDQAESNFAHNGAVHHYGTALDLARQLGDRVREAEILERRARLLRNAFRGEAARDYEDLLAIARATGERQQELEALLGLAGAYYVLALDRDEADYPAQCREQYEVAYELARQLGDKRGMARALLPTIWFTDFWADYDQTEAKIREALALSQEVADEALIIESKLHLRKVIHRREAEPMGEVLLHQLEARRDRFQLNRLYFGLMWDYLRWGNFAHSIACCDAGIRLAAEIGVPPVQYPTIKALALLSLGRYGDAWAALQQEVADTDHPFGRAMQGLGTGIYFLELLEYKRAGEVLKSVIEQARQLRRVWMTHDAQNLLVTALVRAGQLDEATQIVTYDLAADGVPRSPDAKVELLCAQGRWEEALQRAEAVAAQVDAAEFVAEHAAELELRGRILLHMGCTADALALIDRALLLAQETAFLPLVWRLHADKSEGLRALGDDNAAVQAQQAAADVVKRLADTIPEPDQRRHFLADAKVASVLPAVSSPPQRRRAKRR